mmetsp:Transcript_26957/g.104773  ORF Transcript_26957/g.104773 Transcript_26957/m.104773 type:complete len:165 (+) Transcript_26957:1787-2281(+)
MAGPRSSSSSQIAYSSKILRALSRSSPYLSEATSPSRYKPTEELEGSSLRRRNSSMTSSGNEGASMSSLDSVGSRDWSLLLRISIALPMNDRSNFRYCSSLERLSPVNALSTCVHRKRTMSAPLALRGPFSSQANYHAFYSHSMLLLHKANTRQVQVDQQGLRR